MDLQSLKENTSLIFSRENPFYSSQKASWEKNLLAYGGGRGYVSRALVRHLSELEPEYAERLKRTYYTNYPRRIAQAITQYVLSVRPERRGADPDIVEDWNRTGWRTDEVMRQFGTMLTVCGCAWLLVDSPAFVGFKTRKDEIAEKLRPYVVALSPLSVTDWAYGADGEISWAIVKEQVWDNSDPLKRGAVIDVRKVWTRDAVYTISRHQDTGCYTYTEQAHGLGCVPLVRAVEADGYGIGENHWYDDVVAISDSILNVGSEAVMNAVKQMFGLLVIPEDFLDNVRELKKDDDQNAEGSSLACTISRSYAVFESESGKGTTRYISPNGSDTQVLRSEMTAMKQELFNCVGLANTKETRLVESGEAKAWDFQNTQAFLQTRADILEQSEMRAWDLLNLWSPTIPVPEVEYNRNFSALDLKDSVASLLELSSFNSGSDEYQRQIGNTAVSLLNRVRQMPQETIEAIAKEIASSSPVGDRQSEDEMVNAMMGGSEETV